MIKFLQDAVISGEPPNAETIEAMKELENGGGFRFEGTTEEFFEELTEN